MIILRKAEDRGFFDHKWLETYHTFSFAGYYDPDYMGFRDLRVINEDKVKPGKGFGTHPHKDMEIISYVMEGALKHADSMGNSSVIKAGEVQRMTAGTGITHSEHNPSEKERVHFFQIWIVPEETGLTPEYEQTRFPDEKKRGKMCLVASQDGRDGSVTINSNSMLYATMLEKGEQIIYPMDQDRHAWVQVARGAIRINGNDLATGDGAAFSHETVLRIRGTSQGECEVLVFDLG